MEKIAEQTASTLKEAVETENMVGMSYYDEEGVGHVFRSEWAEEKYDPEKVDAIVEELRFEALSHELHEQHQKESLHATVRVYDEMLDIAVPITETKGVVFALDTEGEYSIRDVIDTVEQTLQKSDELNA